MNLAARQTRYVMEMSGQHCGSGPTTVTNVENNKVFARTVINPPLSVCNYK
jgi:hypothetical protein